MRICPGFGCAQADIFQVATHVVGIAEPMPGNLVGANVKMLFFGIGEMPALCHIGLPIPLIEHGG